MDDKNLLRLSAKERQNLRWAVRTHPDVLKHVKRLSDVSALDKTTLIQAAEALGIDIDAAISGKLFEQLAHWDSEEGREQQRRSDEGPAFVGFIEEQITFVLAGETATRTFRASYELTPEWPYIDPTTGDEVQGWEQGSLSYEIAIRRGVTTLRSTGRGKSRQKTSDQVWVNCTELVCEGVFGKGIEGAIDDRIQEACLRENQERKATVISARRKA